jgi:GMP synthase (glutamine-hydrolysing)
MTKKILAVQNIACETLGTFEDLIKSDGYSIYHVLAPRDPLPMSVSNFSAVILLGGPMSVYDELTYLNREQVLIRDAFKRNVPTLGICLGSQLIAGALGGTVYRGSKKEIGWQEISITKKGLNRLFKGLDNNNLRVFQWHGDTYTLPQGAEVLAYSDLYPQAFRVGSLYGLQFHVEVTADMINLWIEEYKEEIKKEQVSLEYIIPKTSNEVNDLINNCSLVWSNFSGIIVKNESS